MISAGDFTSVASTPMSAHGVTGSIQGTTVGGTTGGAPGAGSAGGGGMGGAMGANLAIQGFQLGFQIVNSIYAYKVQKTMLEAQEKSAVAQSNHQDRMAGLSAKMQNEELGKAVEQQAIQVEYAQKYNKAIEARKKEEDRVIIADAKIRQAKVTEKLGKVKSKAFARNVPFYGKPAMA